MPVTYHERNYYHPDLIPAWQREPQTHGSIHHRRREVEKFIENFDQSVLYEDPDMLLINKPAFIASHYGTGNPLGVEEIAKYQRGPEIELVHRLDRGTTGVLALAKNEQACHRVKTQFRHKNDTGMQKTYLALVDGECTQKGEFEFPLEIREGQKTRVVPKPRNNKALPPEIKMSQTIINPIDVIQWGDKTRTILMVELITGRTHQIRAVMEHLGYPITGDQTYNSDHTGAFRPLLHAWSIRLTQPSTGEKIEVQAPIPRDMAFFLNGVL